MNINISEKILGNDIKNNEVYKRNIKKMTGGKIMCEYIFCHKEQIITDFVYKDKSVMAFMDMEPVNEGHVLLVPKQHYLDVDEMPDELLIH